MESLSVPTYRATFDLVDFRTSQKIQAEVTRKRTKMTMIARSYERRIRTGGVTRTGQARLQHQANPKRRHRRKDAEKSVCGEDLRTPRHPLALGTCDVWGGIQGWNQDSVFPSELEAELMDYVNLRSAAVLTAIKSYYSDSSKKFLALMDLMMIPSDPQRIIAGRASVVSSPQVSAAREQGEK